MNLRVNRPGAHVAAGKPRERTIQRCENLQPADGTRTAVVAQGFGTPRPCSLAVKGLPRVQNLRCYRWRGKPVLMPARNVRLGSILLKKSEYRPDANFSASHVRFFETDVGDRIVCIRVTVAASKSIYGGN